MWVGHSGVGRTLLSDAFDVALRMKHHQVKSKIKPKIKGKSVGQECPTHTGYCTVTATLAECDNEPLVAVTVML